MKGISLERVAWAGAGVIIGLLVAQMIGASSFGRKIGLAA